MNRAIFLSIYLACLWFLSGCGSTATPPITPPPIQNPVPTITSVSPTSVTAGASATTLDVKGTNFLASSVVNWNSSPLVTTLVSSTEITAALPAADLTGSSASLVSVHNPTPGGGSSVAVTFDVNSPVATITAISPLYVPTGVSATITITGSGFESNSVVLWNASPRPTTVVSTTELQVTLSAADLQSQGVGILKVSNPGPAASASSPAQLTVTSQPIPVIQSVSVTSAPSIPGVCTQLQVTISGQNFSSNSIIQANGVSLPNIFYPPNPSTITNSLPLGFVSQPGALSFTVTNPGQVAAVSNSFPYPATSAPALALCATPSPTTVFAGTGFSFTVQPSEVNISGNGNLTLGALPSGITSTSSSVPLPPAGAAVHLQAANSAIAGAYDLTFSGAVGTTTAKGDFNFTLSTGILPSFYFGSPLSTEVGVPIGGSGSILYQTLVNSITNVDFDIVPSVSGLPTGTTATFSPPVISSGQSVTVTLSAASTAPVTQNAVVALIGTPSAPLANATASFFVDVTQPPGLLPGNRTDFVSTAGTPYAAVYDVTHNLIFASNPDWNRVDVISNATHKIVKSIPVRSPRGLDITQDDSHVWVQTASPNIYAINTASLQAKQYVLPKSSIVSSGLPVSFAGGTKLLALSDGTLFLFFNDSGSSGGGQVGVWNPQTNQLNVLASGPITAFGVPVRSGDGTVVYASNDPGYKTGIEVYSVGAQSLTTIGSGTNLGSVIAVNHDGSALVLFTANTGAGMGLALYDRNLSLVGTVPGALESSAALYNGGVLFSPDNTKLYEIGAYDNLALVLTIDASSLKVLGTAPSSLTNPVGISGASATPAPFAIDSIGMLLGIQNYGVSFEDSTFYQNYAVNQPPNNDFGGYIATYAGPLAGGAVSSLYVFPAMTPDVWFGQSRGIVDTSSTELTFTSPPSTIPGPVNVKFIFPDGSQYFYPQLFSYSTFPQYAVMSGSAPNGGAPAQVIGYGLPADASSGTLTVGAHTGTITTTVGQYPPFSGEPYPSAILAYTLPPGTPGWTDLQINTPIGTGTLPKSIFYAKSVADYSSSDSLTSVLFDAKRNQLYLSAGDHVDVFSTTSNQFLASLHPAAQGTQKQFTGLALTPDGSQLLVTDLLDGSLAVINPDLPSTTFAIPIAPSTLLGSCPVGPLYVAATSTNLAFVTTGSLPAPACPPYGSAYVANLQTRSVASTAQCTTALGVDASSDGNFVAIGGGPCVYAVATSTYTVGSFPTYTGVNAAAISGDANILASNLVLADASLNMIGAVATPVPFYRNSASTAQASSVLLRPRFNASGSLYYLTYPNYFEIVDVAHAALRMRFSLTETIQNTASPLAIDSGGRHVYLLTDKGLTVVDLGAAPLSIGHLSQQNASPGSQIIVRGSGFDSSTTATIGGVAAPVSFTDENTLTLTIPAAASGPEDIVLTRADGEIYTLENGVVLP